MMSSSQQSDTENSRRAKSYFYYVAAFIALIAVPAYWITRVEVGEFPLVTTTTIPLKRNTRLSNAEKLPLGQFRGAESIVAVDDDLYSGVHEGWIIKINATGTHKFVRLADQSCNEVPKCSRPLGIRLSKDGKTLYVADAYNGVFSVNLQDGSHKKLFPLNNEVKVIFFNDLDVLPDGSIIVSQTSSLDYYHNSESSFMKGVSTGSVFKFNPETKKWKVLWENAGFANGVQLHRDNKTVLVAELSKRRIVRLPIDGGEVTEFASNLPGFPDNIRSSSRGGYWIALASAWIKSPPFTLKVLQWTPIRQLLVRLLSFEFGKQLLRCTSHSMIIRLGEDGEILETLQDPVGAVLNVAEVLEHNGRLYMGSYYLPYISHLKV